MDNERMLKNYLIAALAVLLLLGIMLGYNMMSLKEYREITDGEYITVDQCIEVCDARMNEFMQPMYDENGTTTGVMIDLT